MREFWHGTGFSDRAMNSRGLGRLEGQESDGGPGDWTTGPLTGAGNGEMGMNR